MEEAAVYPVEDFLRTIGQYRPGMRIEPFKRVGNNRTYIIDADDNRYFAKQFFKNREDLRDRFHAEFSFASYAAVVAPGFTPTILASDADSGYILYEFIAGSPIRKDEVTQEHLTAAASFFRKLNAVEARQHAAALPDASEARFSINDHLLLINNRIKQLEALVPGSPEDSQAMETVERMRTIWDGLVEKVRVACGEFGLDPNEQLQETCRAISPSDFGFHNALINANGALVFLDFEYAGWDDPAKMIGDFFGQIQVPVPPSFYEQFLQQSLEDFPDSEWLRKRARILTPVFRMKWACIAMNVFLPVHLARRKFTDPDLNVPQLKQEQLRKASDILDLF